MKARERHKFLSEQVSIYQELIDDLERKHPGLADLVAEGDHPLASAARQLLSYRQSQKTLLDFIATLKDE